MTSMTVRLQRREELAHGTMSFHFDRPAGLSFRPGQAIDLILSDPAVSGTESARHAFSIVSAPHEGELVVATRMRDSAFKNALARLPIGAPAQVEGPFGSLTLHNKLDRAAVFIAGGIGITPFMSMLRHAAGLPWMGETGQVDEALLRRVAAELANPVYYVAGPPDMVRALRDTLERAGVDSDDIRSEEFHGY